MRLAALLCEATPTPAGGRVEHRQRGRTDPAGRRVTFREAPTLPDGRGKVMTNETAAPESGPVAPWRHTLIFCAVLVGLAAAGLIVSGGGGAPPSPHRMPVG